MNSKIKIKTHLSPTQKSRSTDLTDIISSFPEDIFKNLKVLFINMPLRESAKPNTPPQGPALLAARLRNFGAETTILDLNAYRVPVDNDQKKFRLLTFNEAEQLFLRHISKYGDQDIIGFSGIITTLRWQEKFAKICRRYQPDSFLLSGGGLATQFKEGLFHWIDELDAVSHSEGDDIMMLIAKQIVDKKKGVNLSLNNPCYIGQINSRDRFLYSGNRPKNLDILPFPAWDLLEKDVDGQNILEWYIETPVWGGDANNSSAAPFTMKRSLTTVSSRGCPYACTFCYRGAQGERLYGMRCEKSLADEVSWLIDRYNIDFVGFPDDNFAVDKKRIKRLPDAFKELNIRWGTHTRLDEADSRVEDMAKSGCVYIGFGAESASAKVLDEMKKGGFILKRGLTQINGYDLPTTMVDGIKNCYDYGIHSNCTWIMGYPSESLDDLKTSVSFIEWQKEFVTNGLVSGTPEYENAINSINQNMFVATAYPGTEMFKNKKVIQKLSENFGINFDSNLQPILDDNFKQYVLELDDATKLLTGKDGQIINYSDIPDQQFRDIRELVKKKQLSKVLDL